MEGEQLPPHGSGGEAEMNVAMANWGRRKNGRVTPPTENQPVSANENALFRERRNEGSVPLCPNLTRNSRNLAESRSIRPMAY